MVYQALMRGGPISTCGETNQYQLHITGKLVGNKQ